MIITTTIQTVEEVELEFEASDAEKAIEITNDLQAHPNFVRVLYFGPRDQYENPGKLVFLYQVRHNDHVANRCEMARRLSVDASIAVPAMLERIKSW